MTSRSCNKLEAGFYIIANVMQAKDIWITCMLNEDVDDGHKGKNAREEEAHKGPADAPDSRKVYTIYFCMIGL